MIHCRNYRSILPLTPKEVNDLAARVRKDANGCWIWTGMRGVGGYGQVFLRGKTWQVHRVICELVKGPIKPGEVVDHLCCVKLCCNPDHLDVVTPSVNMLRQAARRDRSKPRPRRLKPCCRNGHFLEGPNLIWRKVHGKIQRACKACELAAVRRKAERLKLRAAAVGSSQGAGRPSKETGDWGVEEA